MVDRQVVVPRHLAARPTHLDAVDAGRVAEPEVLGRILRTHVAARQDQQARLHLAAGRDADRRAQTIAVGTVAAQPHQGTARAGGTVLEQARRLVLVVDDDVEIAVAVEVDDHRTLPDALLVEAPFGADVGEAQLAEVAARDVLLGQALEMAIELEGLLPLPGPPQLVEAPAGVGVVGEHGDAVGHERIQSAVLVEVAQQQAPRPIGAGEVGEIGLFAEPSGAGVDVQRIAHVLLRVGVLQEPPMGVHVAHQQLAHVVGRARHVRDGEVEPAVAVDVAEVGPHREERRVREGGAGDLLERAVAAVAVEAIRRVQIVGDVQIEPAVAVGVPPLRGEAVALVVHAGCRGGVDEAAAVVAEQAIALAGDEDAFAEREEEVAGLRGHDQPVAVAFELRVRWEQLLPSLANRLRRRGRGDDLGRHLAAEHAVVEQVQVEVAVVVVVGEGDPHRRGDGVETERRRTLAEGAIALVDVQQVGRFEVGDVEVQIAVAVDVDEAGGRAPGVAAVHLACRRGDVGEAQRRRLPEQLVGAVLAHQVQVDQSVAVVIAGGDARPGIDVGDDVLAAQLVGEREATLGRVEPREARTGHRGAFAQRLGNDRRVARPPGRTAVRSRLDGPGRLDRSGRMARRRRRFRAGTSGQDHQPRQQHAHARDHPRPTAVGKPQPPLLATPDILPADWRTPLVPSTVAAACRTVRNTPREPFRRPGTASSRWPPRRSSGGC